MLASSFWVIVLLFMCYMVQVCRRICDDYQTRAVVMALMISAKVKEEIELDSGTLA